MSAYVSNMVPALSARNTKLVTSTDISIVIAVKQYSNIHIVIAAILNQV